MYVAIPGAAIPVLDANLIAGLKKIVSKEDFLEKKYTELANRTASPRMLKCHFSLPLLPLKALENSKVRKL